MLGIRRREFTTVGGGAAVWPVAAARSSRRCRRSNISVGEPVPDRIGVAEGSERAGPISRAAISFSSHAGRRRAVVEVLGGSICQSLTESVKALYLAMVFGWDETKSIANAKTRGLPFEIAMALFDGPTLESLDRRRDYGERRIKAIGRVIGQILVCVYTDREAVRRIISLRVANRRERDAYRAAYKG